MNSSSSTHLKGRRGGRRGGEGGGKEKQQQRPRLKKIKRKRGRGWGMRQGICNRGEVGGGEDNQSQSE